jgi:hypothetical protein
MSEFPDPIKQRCETCKHQTPKDGGWCYMFKVKPVYVCVKPLYQEKPWPASGVQNTPSSAPPVSGVGSAPTST